MPKFWFKKTQHIINNHLCKAQADLTPYQDERCMVVKKTKVLKTKSKLSKVKKNLKTSTTQKIEAKNNSLRIN